MSDFDKEAEREKLREKYERDKEEREATQRMSDLLLKGATMTNAHCGTCGDPLFQQNGTTFCPSCHGNPDAVEGTGLEARPAEPEAEAKTDEGAADAEADPTDTDASARRGAATGDDADSAALSADAAAGTSRSPPSTRAEPAESHQSDASVSDRGRSPSSDDRPPASGPDRRTPATHSSSVDGDLEAARDALVRSLERFAEKAAAADDPRYAKDCLEAAHEASETLSSLR